MTLGAVMTPTGIAFDRESSHVARKTIRLASIYRLVPRGAVLTHRLSGHVSVLALGAQIAAILARDILVLARLAVGARIDSAPARSAVGAEPVGEPGGIRLVAAIALPPADGVAVDIVVGV